MTVRELEESGLFEVVSSGSADRNVSGVFCCDLLSVAMSRGKEDAAWVTVIGNLNTLAVLDLADMACVILAEGAVLDKAALGRASANGFSVMRTEEPVFETVQKISRLLQEER